MRKLFVLVLACVFVVPGTAQTRESPPSIAYGSTRTSRHWIETPIGNLAVDEGVAWKGVKVYLSLSMDLVATDEQSGKVLWTPRAAPSGTRSGSGKSRRSGATEPGPSSCVRESTPAKGRIGGSFTT